MIVTASQLNVRSGPGETYRVLRRLHRDERVDVLEAAGDWVYVDPGAGWVSRSYLAAPRAIAPIGLAGITAVFGAPGTPECYAGRVSLPEPLKLSWSSGSVSRFACHILMEKVFTDVFAEIHARGLWSLKEFGGCYNDRPTRSGAKKSTHAWGIAVDLNPATNQQGTAGDMPSAVVRVFEEHGFTWGGRWSPESRDPMHFQFATNY